MYKNNEYIYVPKNLFIIGLMNTADRSLKVVDYALEEDFLFLLLNHSLIVLNSKIF